MPTNILSTLPDWISLHDATLEDLEITPTCLKIKAAIGGYHYARYENVLQAIYKNPSKNELVLEINYFYDEINALSLDSSFEFYQSEIIQNEYYNNQRQIHFVLQDSCAHFFDIRLRITNCVWTYIEERKC